MSTAELDKFIRQTATSLGFSKIGITPAKKDLSLINKLNIWLDKGYHATMQWIDEKSIERRDIHTYYPKAKSIISLATNYFTGNVEDNIENGKISNYAWGDDYHETIKPRLYRLLAEIKSIKPKINGVACIDTSPVMEKDLAQKAGIGWIGKHTNIITQEYGSWVFLSELILDIELEYDNPFIDDLCGTCTACLDACPTNAFPEPYVLDSSKCISYLTIEHRGSFSSELKNKLSNWIYGCDICQAVCPWNVKFAQISDEPAFQPRSKLKDRSLNEWKMLSENEFRDLFKGSAVKRTKYKGLIRNINSVGDVKN